MVYILLILLFSAAFIFHDKFKYKQISFTVFAITGFFLMIAASVFCSLRKAGVYSSLNFQHFYYLYQLSAYLRLSFADIYKMSLFGSFLVYLSMLTLMFDMLPQRKYLLRVLLQLPLYIYLAINDPDMEYTLYIMSATHMPNAEVLTSFKSIYDTCMMFAYLAMPVIAAVHCYRNTTFMILKRNAVTMLIYEVIYYFLLLILDVTKSITFYQNGQNSLIKYYGEQVPQFTATVIFTCIIFMVLLILLLAYRIARMQSRSAPSVIKNVGTIDKNLRMILHGYKNRFFAIHQQIDFMKNLKDEFSDRALDMLNSIDVFALESLSDISEKINSLQNVKQAFDIVNVAECTELALDKLFVPDNIKIVRDYSCKDAIIYSDTKCITEMVYNLLQNSIEAFDMKNDEPNPTVTIRIDSESDWILLEITDNGCGINPAEKKHIFAPLFSGKQGKNNLGIGLHYVKKIVSAHRGNIFVKSVPMKYTQFQIYLPAAQNKNVRAAAEWRLK